MSRVPIVQWGCLYFTLFIGVVWSSHCSVGSGVHIVQWGGLYFTLFIGVVWSSYCPVGWSGFHIVQWMVWSSHCSDGWSGVYIVRWDVFWSSNCSVGWSGVHIVQWGDLEFTLFSGMILSARCSVGLSGVYAVVLKTVWRHEEKKNGEVYRGFLVGFRWVWGPHVINRFETRSWAWNLEEKYVQQIAFI